jgi:two-component system, cell cycle response regulator
MTRILVIEDNEANRQLLSYLLEAYGYEVLIAIDGEEGLEVVQREWPDLILCDIQLPKIDGYEIARRLKSTPGLQAIPLIAVTALAMVGDRDKILTVGFEGYITKPFAPETLIAQVEAFLQPTQRTAFLPQSSGPVAGTEAPSRPPSQATLLVVDDSLTNLSLMASTFEPSGYTVIPAQKVQQALVLARQILPDLIFSDLHMPEEDGRSFLKAVKADSQLRHIPFIIISSSVSSQQEFHGLRALGVQEVITRPIEPEQLLALVEACLKK